MYKETRPYVPSFIFFTVALPGDSGEYERDQDRERDNERWIEAQGFEGDKLQVVEAAMGASSTPWSNQTAREKTNEPLS